MVIRVLGLLIAAIWSREGGTQGEQPLFLYMNNVRHSSAQICKRRGSGGPLATDGKLLTRPFHICVPHMAVFKPLLCRMPCSAHISVLWIWPNKGFIKHNYLGKKWVPSKRPFFFLSCKDSWLEEEKDDTASQPSWVAHGPYEEAALSPMAPGRPLSLVIGKSWLLMEFCGCWNLVGLSWLWIS